MKSTTQLAQRISLILVELNKGKRIDVNELADEFNVSIRTIQRDIKERLNFLPWDELGPRFYRLDRQKLDILTEEDIQRFALLPVFLIYSQRLIKCFIKKSSHNPCK